MSELDVPSAVTGAGLALLVAWVRDAIGRWRDDEAQRARLRSLCRLLQFEVARRLDFIGRGPSQAETQAVRVRVPRVGAEEKLFLAYGLEWPEDRGVDAIAELRTLPLVRSHVSSGLLSLREKTVSTVVETSFAVERRLDALKPWIATRNARATEADDLLEELRARYNDLEQSFDQEHEAFPSRSFSRWLLLWLFGRS